MAIEVSNRANNIKPSPTLSVEARAQKLRAAGGDIISLSVGEPDFDTPLHIKEAAIKAIYDGNTKYTPVDGTAEVKDSIVKKFQRENELLFTPEQIIVSNGAKQSFFNLVQALINPGDEVIIPAPYWVSYPDIVILAEGVPVVISASIKQHFKISPAQLEEAITPKTRLIVINSPSNPSGMAYTKQELYDIGQVLLKHPNIIVASDDIYEHILWTHKPFVNILNACPELADRTVVINGVSKAYAMTGWRIGYCAAPIALTNAMKKIQSQSTSNPNSIAQKATIAALNGNQTCVSDMCKQFKIRHDFVVQKLNEINGIECLPSHGTFYCFPNIHEAILNCEGCNDDLSFAEALLLKTGVAVVPGSAFGTPGCIRLSIATSMEKLTDALKRIKTFIDG